MKFLKIKNNKGRSCRY